MVNLPSPVVVLDAEFAGATLRISSNVASPRPGYDEEELGSLACGIEGRPPLWQHRARSVIGAEVQEVIPPSPGSRPEAETQPFDGPADAINCRRYRLIVHVVTVARRAPEQHAMNDDSSRNDDFEVADKGEWYDPVSRSTREVLLSSHDDANAWAIAITKWANPIVRSIHCIVNPTSGTGQARSVWEKLVEPLLRVTPHSVHVHYTQGPGDATTYCKEVTLEAGQSTVFAVVGGDGSMSEALNGLMHRTDAERGRFTVCFVPAGSSNAMAHMLGMGDPLTAAWALAKGRQQAMDLFAFHQGIWSADGFRPSRLTMYGFLSVTQGLVADIDIDSECMRCCGDVRYTAYTIGKLFCCCCCSICAPGHARTVYPSRIQWLTAESSAGEGTTQRILQDTKPQRGPVYNLDSPDHRQAWTGDLQFFNLLAAPAIDKKMHLSPGKRLDDAALHLQWMTPKCNLSLVGEFSRMEASTHLSSPGWADCKVVAVRVDGLDASSKVVVDGERVKDGESWQAEVLPSYVNVVVGSGPLISFGANNEQSQSESPSCRLPIPKSRVPSATL